MSDINRSINVTLAEGAAGILFGSVFDAIFPSYRQVNNENFIPILLESLGQMFLNALMVQAVYQKLDRGIFNIGGSNKDIIFTISLIGTQPNLLSKLGSLSNVAMQNVKQKLNPPKPEREKRTTGDSPVVVIPQGEAEFVENFSE